MDLVIAIQIKPHQRDNFLRKNMNCVTSSIFFLLSLN